METAKGRVKAQRDRNSTVREAGSVRAEGEAVMHRHYNRVFTEPLAYYPWEEHDIRQY